MNKIYSAAKKSVWYSSSKLLEMQLSFADWLYLIRVSVINLASANVAFRRFI